jgi:hypothetical protein
MKLRVSKSFLFFLAFIICIFFYVLLHNIFIFLLYVQFFNVFSGAKTLIDTGVR